MESNNTILVLLPDGIGLRNFVYTDFAQTAQKSGLKVVYWNGSPLDLSPQYEQVWFDQKPVHPATNIYKYIKTKVELTLNEKRSGDAVYRTYYFEMPLRNTADRIKKIAMRLMLPFYQSEKGLQRVHRKIESLERSTPHYQNLKQTLQTVKPAMVFCTNQRHLSTVAAILAARDLGIPTAALIFSWDNLPKATMFLSTDYYVVWSDHMKRELMYYGRTISEDQILVTGTPQFEPHANRQGVVSREEFCQAHGLDARRRYICFSGDDVTTSPHDPIFLSDTARAVRQLNEQGHNLGILFRRCPVDFSGRYDKVVQEYQDVIVPLDPLWERAGQSWGHVMPTAADLKLQLNTIAHSEMVINLGSSMVFDFVSFDKPCAYIRYDVKDNGHPDWSVKKIYNYVHFRSMPSSDAVIWIDSPQDIAPAISAVLSGRNNTVDHARRWFDIINCQPAELASQRIIDSFKKIIAHGHSKRVDQQ